MKKLISVLLSVLMIGLTVGCGSSKSSAKTIVIYDGQFSEMQLIHRMVKLIVEQDTDLTVDIRDEMSPINCFNELVKGGCDLMNGYDGTLLTTYLKMDTSTVPEGQTLYDFANATAIREKKVRLLDKIGINNTYVLAVPQEIGEKYKLETISDLIPVAGELVFVAEHEFFSEEGSMKFAPLTKFYGLNFKEAKPIDLGLKYSAAENGKLDVTVVYATDGLNKKANLKILVDDRHYFPEYNGALLVRDDLFERFKDTPNLEAVLNKLGGAISDIEMVNLTYAVDVEGKTVQEMAESFLRSKGILNAA